MSSLSFSGGVFCITGGTGSFGSNMVRHLLVNHPEITEIRVFSRDENKQDSLRHELQSEKVKYYLGDVRELSGLQEAVKGANFVFHAAALKQVPSCEFFPEQAVLTNINGSGNVVSASLQFGISSLVCLSTDKAVYPINAMGLSKAMMEKIAQAPARKKTSRETNISITRYGNVMMSRGSVIPLFAQQILSGNLVTITDPNMTRFMMSLKESIDLVLHAFVNAQNGDLFVREAPACTVDVLVKALQLILDKPKIEKKIIGIRHGEKLHESLLTNEELVRSEKGQGYFRIPMDSRTLNYEIYTEVGSEWPQGLDKSYTSENTRQLNERQVAEIISNLPEFNSFLGVK